MMWLMPTQMDVVLFLLSLPVITALRDARLTIPMAVRRGDNVTFNCYFDIEDDGLYSVKWYKGAKEFSRFTPKENPALKIFPNNFVTVKRSASNESHLLIDNVQPAATGRYSCEISAEAPSFHTQIASAELRVVEVPDQRPTLSGFRQRYRIGDIVRGNCTSRHSKPAANLTWTINEVPANPSHVRAHKPFKEHNHKGGDLETSILGLHFVVSGSHFSSGKLKIRCTAKIFDTYWEVTDKVILEERPKVQSPSGNSISYINKDPSGYDPSQLDVGDMADNKFYNIKGDMSSLSAGGGGQILKAQSIQCFLVSFFIATLSTSLL